MAIESIDSLMRKPTVEWFGSVTEIPVELIKPDPENLRQEFDENDLRDLGKNIQEIGQLDDITVFPVLLDNDLWAGHFDLHDGERRWRAATLVGIPQLRAKIVPRPSDEELLYKKVTRVLQTRTLSPEKKVVGLEKALGELGVLNDSPKWESYKDKLGGGQEWPQLIRVLMLKPRVRGFMEEGLINFTIAQSIGRLPPGQQEQIAEYVVVNKINGRFFSTQMVPYLIENPDASPAQAFEHTRVGGWKQYTRSPYQKGEAPPLDQQVENFLEACVKWERAWEVAVQMGLVFDVKGNPSYEYRLKDAARRIIERARGLEEKIGQDPSPSLIVGNESLPPNTTQ